LLEEVSTGPRQALNGQRPRTREHVKRGEETLAWPSELPLAVGWILVVRRDGDSHVAGPSRFEQPGEIGDHLVLGDALTEDRPSGTVGAQEIVLGVDHDQRRPSPVECELRVREVLPGLLAAPRRSG